MALPVFRSTLIEVQYKADSMMGNSAQDVLCVLLQALLDRGLISGDVCGRAREKVLGTLDLPPFFRNGEDADGSSENPR